MNYLLRNAKVKYPAMAMADDKGEHEYAQNLDFDISQLPEIAMWKVGEEYLLVVKVKQTSHSMIDQDGKVEEKGCFDVVEVGALKDDAPKDDYKEVDKKLGLK